MPTTPEDIYKEEITIVIRDIKDDPDLTINFRTAVLSQHLATDKQAKSSMIYATNRSAMRFGRYLNHTGTNYVFNKVNRKSAYSDILTIMDTAISIGSNPFL